MGYPFSYPSVSDATASGARASDATASDATANLRRRSRSPWSAWLLTGLTSLSLGTIGLTLVESLHPPIAQAYVSRLAVSLNHASGETYETLVRRAETVARAAAQRSFDNDILVTQVAVMISGTNKGIEVPILTLDVSRFQWRSQPDTRKWAVYFPGSRSMLGLPRTNPNEGLPPANTVKPVAPTPATTPPAVLRVPAAPPVAPGGSVPVRSGPGRGSVPLPVSSPGSVPGSLQTVPGSVSLPQPPVR